MDVAELVAVAAILVGILLTIVVFIWQTNSQNTRLEAKIDAQVASLRSEMDAQSASLRAEIRSVSDRVDALTNRIGEYEQRNARLDGVNETLSEILRQQSHTHEAAD